MLHFALHLVIYPPVAHDNLGNPVLASYINNPQLQVLQLCIFQDAVVQVIGFLAGQPFADAHSAGKVFHIGTVFRMHPRFDVILNIPAEFFRLECLFKLYNGPAAQAVRQYFVRIQVGIEDGFIIDAQSLDDFQAS